MPGIAEDARIASHRGPRRIRRFFHRRQVGGDRVIGQPQVLDRGFAVMLLQRGIQHLVIEKGVSRHRHSAHRAGPDEDLLDPRPYPRRGGHAQRDGPGMASDGCATMSMAARLSIARTDAHMRTRRRRPPKEPIPPLCAAPPTGTGQPGHVGMSAVQATWWWHPEGRVSSQAPVLAPSASVRDAEDKTLCPSGQQVQPMRFQREGGESHGRCANDQRLIGLRMRGAARHARLGRGDEEQTIRTRSTIVESGQSADSRGRVRSRWPAHSGGPSLRDHRTR